MRRLIMDQINLETIRRLKLLRAKPLKQIKKHDLLYGLCVDAKARIDKNRTVSCPKLNGCNCSYKQACNYSKTGREEICYHLTPSF